MRSSDAEQAVPDPARVSCAALVETRSGVLDIREIGGARPRPQMPEQRVVALVGFLMIDRRILLVKVAEGDGASWASALAGGLDLVQPDRTVFPFGGPPCAADALNAVGALFHNAACPHCDIRVFLGAIGFQAEVGVFLAVRIAEEIEAPYLVGTVRLAKPRADAA